MTRKFLKLAGVGQAGIFCPLESQVMDRYGHASGQEIDRM